MNKNTKDLITAIESLLKTVDKEVHGETVSTCPVCKSIKKVKLIIKKIKVKRHC